jgi:hypothetical protein
MKLGSGCTIIEVAKFLGYWASPILLSRLVKHVNIPKWSRCKPVAYSRTIESKATQAEQEAWFDSIGWGFEMDSVSQMNTDSQMYGSAITLSQGDVWHYSGMTPTEDYPARLGDFRWCNSDAEVPFLPVELYYYVPGVDKHKGPVIELKWGRNLSQNSEINPYNYNLLRGNYHILLKKSGSTTGASMVSTAVTDSFTSVTTPRIILTSAETGTYECCAAIKRGGGEGEIYPLPDTYISIELRNQTEEEYAGLALTNQCSMTKSSTVGQLTVRLKVLNLTNETITAIVGCEVLDNRGSVVWQKLNHSVSVPANSSITLYGNENQNFVTTDPGTIRVEDIGPSGTFRPPISAECRAKNSLKSDVEMIKTAQILDS